MLEWTQRATRHIQTRSQRYSEAADIDPAWAIEAASDPRAVLRDPDPRSRTGALRIIGFSETAGFLITVIAQRIDGVLWGVTAWKTSGADRRAYGDREVSHD